jgi:hypothetical protein
MSKIISVEDLKLIPELSHLRTLDFIDPKNADLIAPFLKIIGMDMEFPIEFIACQHRTLQGKVVVSYQLVGSVECNDSFLSSSFASVEDRIIAAAYRDLSLAQELGLSQTSSRDYGDSLQEGFPPELCNPDEKEILAQIQILKDLLFLARGNPNKNDGSLKLFHEANTLEPDGKRRKKSVANIVV